MHKVTIMGKKGCHLCDVAEKVVQTVIAQHADVIIEKVDITRDPALLEKYHDDIPVVLVDNVERFKHHVDANALAQLFYDDPGEKLLGLA